MENEEYITDLEEENENLAEYNRLLVEKIKDAKENILNELATYEADVRLTLDSDEACKLCNDSMFKSVRNIIEKHLTS